MVSPALQPNICYTVTGYCFHQEKVVLVHHKKSDLWLPPGGHIDDGELPHQAIEREYTEETSLKVEAINTPLSSRQSEFLPIPISANLHWINQDAFHQRQVDQPAHTCEQHYNLSFLVKLESSPHLKPNLTEIHQAKWMPIDDLTEDILPDIQKEIRLAYQTYQKLS